MQTARTGAPDSATTPASKQDGTPMKKANVARYVSKTPAESPLDCYKVDEEKVWLKNNICGYGIRNHD